MSEKFIPSTITGFTEYIKIAFAKAEANIDSYGIAPEKLAAIEGLYNAYVAAEAIAANPETATVGARRVRDNARKALEPEWRKFINEYIRYNSNITASDLEVFGIRERDTTKTPAGTPDAIPVVSVKTVGVRRMEVEVFDSASGKKKKPQFATGSYIYLAVTEVGQTPHDDMEFHKLDFSSNCHHVIEFPLHQLAKQANIYARYANARGKEGPEGPSEVIVIS